MMIFRGSEAVLSLVPSSGAVISSACVYLETTDNDTDDQQHINVSFLHVYKQEIEEEEYRKWMISGIRIPNYTRSLHNKDDTAYIRGLRI